MVINWYGQSFFKIESKNNFNNLKEQISLCIDPFDESLGLKVPKIEAQICLVTHQHRDHSNIKAVKGDVFLIKEPGEYEVRGIFIKGIPSFHDNSSGKERGENIIYKIEAEGIKICHLGDLGQKELNDQQLEEIGEVDILMVPVGGNYTVGPKEASEIIAQIEPRLIIPMHYKLPKLKLDIEGVEKFLKVMGDEKKEPQKKLKVSQKDLPKEESEIVVLTP
jgi:L-ascorbate metabolism protein UlaG (beta-lactamase superfamily)